MPAVISPSPNTAPPQLSKAAKQTIQSLIGRVALLAAGVDVFYLLFFLVVGSPWLAWMNLLSVAMYSSAYVLVRRRRLHLAVLLIWLEAFPHAIIGTLMLGWESGFHYLLLMFIPAVVVTSSSRRSIQFIVVLLVTLGALDALSRHWGPLAPISDVGLIAIKWINISIFVAMFSALASYYRKRIASVEQHLQELASNDELTGIANRRRFDEVLAREWARSGRANHPLALIMLDVDHFKNFNDHYGHQAGDECLRKVASELRKSARRPGDLAARYGGEEFAVIAADMDADTAMRLAETLRESIAALALPHAQSPLKVVTISVGVAVLTPGDGNKAEALLGMADQALYRAKRDGRNRVESAPA